MNMQSMLVRRVGNSVETREGPRGSTPSIVRIFHDDHSVDGIVVVKTPNRGGHLLGLEDSTLAIKWCDHAT